MKDYVNIVINMEEIKNGITKNHIHEIGFCNYEQFAELEIEVKIDDLDRKLCPTDVNKDDDLYKIMGHHSSKDNRNSLSLQFRECDLNQNSNCKSEEEVTAFLKNVYFKVNIIEKRIDFGESTKYSNLIETIDNDKHADVAPIH